MRHRLFLTVLATLLASVAPVAAQQRGHGDHPHPRGHQHAHDSGAMVEHLAEKLDLNAEQQEAVRPIFEQAHNEHQALMESMRPSEAERQQMREAMQAIGERTEAQLAEILTEEQMTQFRTMKAEHQAKMREHRDKRRSGRS